MAGSGYDVVVMSGPLSLIGWVEVGPDSVSGGPATARSPMTACIASAIPIESDRNKSIMRDFYRNCSLSTDLDRSLNAMTVPGKATPSDQWAGPAARTHGGVVPPESGCAPPVRGRDQQVIV